MLALLYSLRERIHAEELRPSAPPPSRVCNEFLTDAGLSARTPIGYNEGAHGQIYYNH
jgi:hypothetical protein